MRPRHCFILGSEDMFSIFHKLLGKRTDGKPFCSAVVVAAGLSQRMSGQNKLFALLHDKPILAYTLDVIDKCESINEIILVTKASDISNAMELCNDFGIQKVSKIICGGDTRTESAWLGVNATSFKAKLIAIHDGARPFVTQDIIDSTIAAANTYNAAAPAFKLSSTIKKAEKNIVIETVDRENLYEIQTPQVFDADIIKCALKNAMEKNLQITDDCMALEALGLTVRLTEGSKENIKLTTPDDLSFAEAILNNRRSHI